MTSKLIFFVFFIVPWSVYGQRPKPGDFPWRIRFLVANGSDPFTGSLKIDIYFDSKSGQNHTLDIGERLYEPGSTHSSLEKLSESGMNSSIPRIVISAVSSNCTNQSLSLIEISLTSFHKRTTFRKRFRKNRPLLIKSQCGNQSKNGSGSAAVDNFESDSTGDCYYHGEFYDADQSFDIGCEMVCRCHEGMVDCDTMCKPPSMPIPRNCRTVTVDRRCCDEFECLEDALWDSCSVHTAARDKMPPWAVVLAQRNDQNQSEIICGASIIHKK